MAKAENFIESLEQAERALRTADHMAYVTFPLIKEKRLLFKILEGLYAALLNTINAILQYEYAYKRINLYRDSSDNFATFSEKCAVRFGISQEQIKTIKNLFLLIEKHKNSPFEFIKQDKIVIMSDNLHTDTLSIDKIKEFLLITKDILRKANGIIRRGYSKV